MKKKEYRERLYFQHEVNNALEDELCQERDYNRRLHRGVAILERSAIVVALMLTIKWVAGAK